MLNSVLYKLLDFIGKKIFKQFFERFRLMRLLINDKLKKTLKNLIFIEFKKLKRFKRDNETPLKTRQFFTRWHFPTRFNTPFLKTRESIFFKYLQFKRKNYSSPGWFQRSKIKHEIKTNLFVCVFVLASSSYCFFSSLLSLSSII